MGKVLRAGAWLAIVLLAIVPAAATAKSKKVKCGQTITKSLSLPNDLKNCLGDGLIVTKDKVTIDLKGHSIDAAGEDWDGTSQSAGIRVVGRKSFSVKNGTIKGFGTGISLEYDGKPKISKVSLASNGAGIALWETEDASISKVKIQKSWAAGVLINSSRRVTIDNSTAWGSYGHGFQVAMGSQFVTFTDNEAFLNQANGFQVDADTLNTVLDGNRAVHNSTGIKVETASAWIGNNETNDNDPLGIDAPDEVTDGGRNVAHDNTDPEYDCKGVICEESDAAWDAAQEAADAEDPAADPAP